MTIEEAQSILTDLTKGESLLRHARSVEIVMRAYAQKLGEDEEEWAVTGLLHDADYEKHPEEHPNVIVNQLNEMGETKIAHAISAHYTKWGVSYTNTLDKALLACDELTGFIIACCQVRPEGINTLNSKSVIKKLKQKSFAAKVERDEVQAGADMLDVPMKEHIDFIIEALKPHKEELKIG
ncbi:HD domain-containing protein [Fulvivirga ligni]|uniref:HD domain-containing protein n=1 Tax=Fulvivirga ligni TaxID=2904246 RepID=UPI001F421CAA|nr:HD domain-containing protein [Fulvivirga ligni]UII21054.1 HD domain-containing protein [Fulvivirga ligni]